MNITGKLFIDGDWQQGSGGTYQAVNPASGQRLDPPLSQAGAGQVKQAVAAAAAAAPVFRKLSLQKRADFLNACADEIMALGDALLERVMAETGYPRPRVETERARTCNQLKLFASTALKGDWLNARIDTAMPERKPLPRPDIRYLNQALGPVVVFGSSNFPLAFSVAGGDTASAFAAGCPVLVKGHSSHPGTCELVAHAIATAVKKCGLPGGVFSLLMGSGREVGAALVSAPEVKAVGFTGSFAGGMALAKAASERPEPIPVFAEMGSVNPVFLLPGAAKARAAQIAEGFVASLTLGTGQFCTNPGMVIALDDEATAVFIAETARRLAEVGAGVLLNEHICSAYAEGIERFSAHKGVARVAQGKAAGDSGYYAQAALYATTADYLVANSEIQEEVFGPVSLLVKCKSVDEMLRVAGMIKGQLTATLQAESAELAAHSELVDRLGLRAGRLLVNGFPTGVEVCDAMVHGGPFPATTDSRFTSVGTTAIARFVRPVCYQNFPEALLPDALRNHNPLNLMRMVNGEQTRAGIS
ncbi:MAG TPA: aldehyde dehydrogenase (NADP(+)) [Gammaproteobacteria bacterium]|nr:aldehyde dehydrogenase (NADP(+)) [Gammaproteobacteria bacterium]